MGSTNKHKKIRQKSIIVLGVESSCDETAAAVVKDGWTVLSNVISSQVDIHSIYGGVVPEIASRLHIENINGVVRLALKNAGMSLYDIDVIAVTKGPGLVGALLVGVSFSKALAFALKKPLVGVNHIEAHIAANYISHPSITPPYVCLVVSGGHTELIIVRDYTEFEVIGRTLDDAAGETFDKVARAIGLDYPGGPKLDEAALGGDRFAIPFPRGNVDSHPFDFSFSGMKSSVLNYINSVKMMGKEVNIPDLSASFEESIVQSLVQRTVACALKHEIKIVAMAGGVSANTALRNEMKLQCKENDLSLFFPEKMYCTDNAAMVACAGYFDYMRGHVDNESLNAWPDLELSGLKPKAGKNEY